MPEGIRSAQEVARRAFALALYKWRASYESGWLSESFTEQKAMTEELAEMRAFLLSSGLISALSTIEADLFAKVPGSWHPVDEKEGNWRGENLLALLWALGMRSLPPVCEQSLGVHAFIERVADQWEWHVAEATLRPTEEIERMSDYLEAVRLRGRTPDGFKGIRQLAERVEELVGKAPVDDDLPIAGKPFHALDTEAKNIIRSVAMERHRALAWVLGTEDDLDAPAPEV